MGVIPWSPLAGGWLSGRWRKGADDLTSRRSAMIPQRYDLSIPANQAKLEAADALARLADEAGISLIHLALAFVIRHPAVTAAIIGPRTMEQLESQLGAADVAARRRGAGPHRRDRGAGDDGQPDGRRLEQPRAGGGGPPQVETPLTAQTRGDPTGCGTQASLFFLELRAREHSTYRASHSISLKVGPWHRDEKLPG